MIKKTKKGRTRNRVRKMTFQSQSRTNIIPIDRGTKYKDNGIEQWLQSSRSKSLELNGGMNIQLKIHGN